MPKLIQIPGQESPVEFPDSMSDAQIANAIQKNFPELRRKSFAERVARNFGLAGRDVATGIAALPLMVADLPQTAYNAVAGGVNMLGGNLPRWNGSGAFGMFRQGLTEMGFPNPETPQERIISAAQQGMVGGALGGPALQPALNATLTAAVAKQWPALAGQMPRAVAASPQIATGATGAAQIAAEAGRNAIATGIIPGATAGATVGVAQELGVTNPIALQVLGMAGGALPGIMASIPGWSRRNAGKMLQEALRETTDEEWQQAQQLLAKGRDVGVPLTGPEGFDANNPVQQLASKVSASPTGGPAINRTMQARPGRMSTAANTEMERVGTNVGPQEAANQAQEAATGVIRQAEIDRTRAASPYYQAAENYGLSIDRRVPIYQEIDRNIAATGSADVKASLMKLQTDLNNAGSNSGKLNDVIKVWRDKIDAPVIRADAIDKNTGRVIGKVLQLAEEAITAAAPEYSQGKRVYQARTSMSVDPLNQGPVGKVAGVGFEPDKAATLPRVLSELGGDAATPQRIRTLATELRAKDPQAFPNIARAYLEQEFGKAFSDVQSGANRMSGANFRKNIFGNDAQRANLKTMIEEVASAQGQNPREVWSGFQKMLDVFEATGRTPGIGSQTDIRGEMGRMSRQSKAAGALEVVSTTPTASVAGWWRDVVSRGAYRELADVFTSPDAIAQMRKLAKMRTGSSASTQAVAAIIGSTSGKGAEQQENAGP